ncbi:MAG TPA: hypothetical protein VFA68_20385 [Terriglobales bacterium]|nr:hypothetical protein [Terriglobales bacterium]
MPNEKPLKAQQEETEIVCPHCSETFIGFLQQMADHNLTVTCPRCGKTHPHQHLS